MNVLFTGGSGLLGREVRKLRPGWYYPAHTEHDICCWTHAHDRVEAIVHAAAVTSPPRVDKAPVYAAHVNIRGTLNMVEHASDMDALLVYISTDYVFSGAEGNYAEEDALHPVNKYAWSKLGGECAVRMYDRGLIVRGSFGPVPFPYDRAFSDQWTSRLPVEEFALRLVAVVEHDPPLTGVVHICDWRKSVYEYASNLPHDHAIGQIKRSDVSFVVPRDTSLISTRKDLP